MLKRLLMILAIVAMLLPFGATVGCDDEPDVQWHEQRHLEVHDVPVETHTVVE